MTSIEFRDVYFQDSYTILGPLESNGKIKNYDYTMNDYYMGCKTTMDSEVLMQKKVLDNLIFKNKLSKKIDLVIGSDLTNQLVVSNLANSKTNIPFLGIYNACSSFIEGVIIAGEFLNNKNFNNIIVITSSHNLNAERQFRFPIEYGGSRKEENTFTMTSSVGLLVSNNKSNIKVEYATIGNVVDYNITDVNNIGAVMVPGAIDTLITHLKDTKRDINYYDLILTGDLGSIGSNLFKESLERFYNLKPKKYLDAACLVYLPSQDKDTGASGPAVLPTVLLNKILPNSKYKKILVIATGSLHSKDSVNQKKSIPSIAHAISLEVL